MLVRDIFLYADEENPVSKGISIALKSPYSHSAIQIKETLEVIEAVPIKVINSDNLLWNYKNSKRKKVYSEWYVSKVDPRTFVGKKYEYGRYINFLSYRILLWLKFTKWANYINSLDNPKRLVCLEINARCRGFKNPQSVTPKDFEPYLIYKI